MFIPGSLFHEYNFGHHHAYLFPEQQLGIEYVVDYMLLGKNSDGFSIVLVEFENANVSFLQKNQNQESKSVRDGLTQIRDWKRWVDNNRRYFLSSIMFLDKDVIIPVSRIHYLLVVSRRHLMKKDDCDVRSQIIYETP